MKNKKKLIIFCFALLIGLLTVFAITYSYIKADITGNNSITSVNSVTGKSELTLTIISEETDSPQLIEPGFTDIKVFKVTNTGNDSVIYSIYLDDVTNTFVRKSDVVYTLYKKSGNQIDVNNLSNNDIASTGVFPNANSYILFNETIEPSETYIYALKVEYLNLNVNQDDNKGKTFSSKVQIQVGISNIFNVNSLAYSLLESALNVTDQQKSEKYAEFMLTPLSNPGHRGNLDDESILSVTQDDLGLSYYFRGDVANNYVDFAGMCWRIVRIEGDGSVKIILEDKDSTCSTSDGNWNISVTTGGSRTTGIFGVDRHYKNTLTASDGVTKNPKDIYIINYLNGNYHHSDYSIAAAFENFQTGPLSSYLTSLKSGDWCLEDTKAYTQTNAGYPYTFSELTSAELSDRKILAEDTSSYYSAARRISNKTPSLRCEGTIMTKYYDNVDMYVATVQVDEVAFAGLGNVQGSSLYAQRNNYLVNSYAISNQLLFWSLSPYRNYKDSDYVYYVGSTGYLHGGGYVNNTTQISIRPAVTLKYAATVSGGIGTKTNPYQVG